VLCDAKSDLIMFNEGEYRPLPSKGWWKAPEQLIADNEADDNCTLAPPSLHADVYGAALTVGQVYMTILNSSAFYADPFGHGRYGHYGAHSTIYVMSLNL
jgi:hypothetical protein